MHRRAALQKMVGTAAGALSTAWAPQVLGNKAMPSPLQIVGPWDVPALEPATSGHIFTRLQVTQTLLEISDEGQILPGLVTSWAVSADGLVWRLTLRPQVQFHDQTPLTAESVLPSLRAAQKAPAVLSLAPIDDIGADGHTVRIRLKSPYAGLLALLAHSSTSILSPQCFDARLRTLSIHGTGPYRVTELKLPQSVGTQSFEAYSGPRPAVEHVKYLAASRVETRALMAEAGQSDLAWGMDPASLQRLRKRAAVRIEQVTLPRTIVLKLNVALPFLRDLNVRRALSWAIDRQGIAKALLRDPDLAATQLLAPSLSNWHDPQLPALRFDLSAAQQALRHAGWRQEPGDPVWRDAQGQVLSLTLRTFPDRPELPLLATALQAQWRALGIAVQVLIGNSGDIPLAHRDGSLQMGLAARNYANIPDITGTLVQDFGPGGGDWGAMGWQHEEFASVLRDLSRGGVGPDQVAAMRRNLIRILHEELPVIPIAWYRQQVAVSSRVTGLRLDPLERSYRLTELQWRS